MIKIEFTQEELNALIALMDSGVKSIGLAAATNAAVLLQKIQTAAQSQIKTDDVVDAEEVKEAA